MRFWKPSASPCRKRRGSAIAAGGRIWTPPPPSSPRRAPRPLRPAPAPRRRIAAAAEGTLLLVEVGELSPGAQQLLLHLLQERRYCPVGAGAPRFFNGYITRWSGVTEVHDALPDGKSVLIDRKSVV